MSLFFWLVVALVAVALLLRVDFIYYVLYVAVGVFVWSQWSGSRALRNLVAERRFARRAFLGEIVDITIRLTNNSRLALPWVQFSESVPPELRLEDPTSHVVTLHGRQTVEHSYRVRAQQRGYYQIGPLRLRSGDLFGLSKSRLGLLAPEYLTVYPRIIPLTRLGIPSRLPFGTIASKQRLFEDPARPMGIRPFRSGDSLRRMNWKASARIQQLQVRTLEPAISLETALYLDLNSEAFERRNRQHSTEWAIVLAASLASHLIGQRQAVGLATSGVDPLRSESAEREYSEASGRLQFNTAAGWAATRANIPPAIRPRTGREQLMKMLEQLARIESAPTVPFESWAPESSVHLSWGVTIMAITAAGTDSICNTLHQLTKRGFNAILIAVEPDYNFGRVRDRARRMGFQALNVSGPKTLDEWRAPATGRLAPVAA